MRPIQIQRSSVVLWVCVVLLVALVVLSMTLRRDEEVREDFPEKSTPVYVERVQPQAVIDVLRLPGRLEPHVRSLLAVDRGGRVTNVQVDRGDRVAEGQLLLKIDDRVWRALKQQAEAEWRDAGRALERATELAESGTISTGEFDAIQARFERAEAQLTHARVQVEQCSVFSPLAGIIQDRFVEVGEFTPEGAAVFELIVSEPIKLAIDLPEREMASARVGEVLPFKVSVLGAQTFTARITFVAESAGAHHNTYRVEANVDAPADRLRPGMIASVEWTRTRSDAEWVVPLAAVIPRKGEHFVFVAQGDRAVRRLVKIDRILGADAILAEGLEPGDELVLEGHRELIDGALIQRVTRDGQPIATRLFEDLRPSC